MSDFLETLKARRTEVVKDAQRAVEAYDVAIAREESLLRMQPKTPARSAARSEPADDGNSVSGEIASKAGLIQNAIKTAGTNGVTFDDLDTQLKTHGIKRQYLHTVMHKLIKDRHQVQKRRGRYYWAEESSAQPTVLQ